MTRNRVPAPPQGQDTTTFTRPSQDLVPNSTRATVINVSQTIPTVLDVRIRDRYARYVSDPRADGGTPGIWRTGGSGTREKISPLALVRIAVGRGEHVEILAIHPKTGDYYPFEGRIDDVVSEFHRAGARLGIRTPRARIFWAIYEFVQAARRRAEGGSS